MKIAVCVKQIPDTWGTRTLDMVTGILDRDASDPVPDEINERAMEVALSYQDSTEGVEVIAISMGPENADKTLRKMLAMGADSAVLVSDVRLAGSDVISTSRVLATVLEHVDADLVLAGTESTDGNSGLVPAMIAELMGRPVLPAADQVEISASEVTGSVQGDGATFNLSVQLPAVVSVTEKVAEPRFPNFKSIRAAKKKPLKILSLEDLGINGGPDAAQVRSVMVSAEQRQKRSAGPKIIDDGTAAKQLANFLADRRLI